MREQRIVGGPGAHEIATPEVSLAGLGPEIPVEPVEQAGAPPGVGLPQAEQPNPRFLEQVVAEEHPVRAPAPEHALDGAPPPAARQEEGRPGPRPPPRGL